MKGFLVKIFNSVILANIGKPAVNDVDDAKPGPSRMETQSQKRPASSLITGKILLSICLNYVPLFARKKTFLSNN